MFGYKYWGQIYFNHRYWGPKEYVGKSYMPTEPSEELKTLEEKQYELLTETQESKETLIVTDKQELQKSRDIQLNNDILNSRIESKLPDEDDEIGLILAIIEATS